jgi:DNA-binding beta-propeller fold protein YncE
VKGVGLGVLAALLAACAVPEQTAPPGPADPTARPAVEVARFRDARALATDGALLYVVDAAAATVAVLSPEGARARTFGGPGTGDYGLLEPAGVDPTNGLELFVADAGNARLQRFSHDGRFIASLPVPLGEPRVVGQPGGARCAQNGGGTDPCGRPVAVAVGPADALYAVEAERGVVLQWEGRRLARLLGADGPEALAEPADLAVTADGTVFVADRARGAVLVYSSLGVFRRAVSGEAAGGARAVGLARGPEGERLLVVGPRAVAVHRAEGGLVEVVRVVAEEELVDAALLDGRLYVLTPTRLLRVT